MGKSKLEKYKALNAKIVMENYEREIANLPKKLYIIGDIEVYRYNGSTHNELNIKVDPCRHAKLFRR